jgi:3',5'-cyclic AMP phosphodiesterase CpdA
MPTFVLAHLSDPHLAPLPTPSPFELMGKRIGGFINWQKRRRHFHLAPVLDRIVDDLKAQSVDHIAVTGDLVNLSLPAEFPQAYAFLKRLGPPPDVTVVPGNHDTYVWSKRHHPERHWADYMRGDAMHDDTLPTDATPRFPFVRRRGPVTLIGVSTAVPTLAFRATGRLGAAQIGRLAALLDEHAGTFRVVLIHHPPQTRPEWRARRLIDGDAFIAVLRKHGAELVLHGHEHFDLVRWFDTPRGKVAAVGVPSASGAVGWKYDPAAYNLYLVDGSTDAWRCEMISRGVDGDGTRIVERKRMMLMGEQ